MKATVIVLLSGIALAATNGAASARQFIHEGPSASLQDPSAINQSTNQMWWMQSPRPMHDSHLPYAGAIGPH
jgi:hypothetical protein